MPTTLSNLISTAQSRGRRLPYGYFDIISGKW